MSLRITNIAALGAQRQLSKATRALEGNYQRLSSGLRINSAKDDPAGLCICDRMTSQINGLTQGNRNANDGISLCQIADGAMDEMTEIVQRMRTLAVQSANGTNSSSERQAIQDEVNELCAQLEYISSSTSFGGSLKLLNGSSNNGTFSFQVGANANETVSVNIGNVSYSQLLANATSAGNTVSTSSYQIGSSNAVSVLSADDAQNAIGTFDSMISYIDHARSQCGAVANRLEHTISYQEIMIENVSDARSRIRDTDYAAEIADMARNNILQQVATTMLTHALRSHNSMIMSLLGAI